ncbi:MAG: class B sortase, partial [Clostridia bacterium]|nr:class B sortase [Clostridia bacterium]
MKAHVIWYRSRPSEGITARLRTMLRAIRSEETSQDVTIKPESIPLMLSNALKTHEIVIIIGGMDLMHEEENSVFILSKCLSIPLERGNASRSSYIHDSLRATTLPSLDGSILFPSRGGGPEGVLLTAGEQTILLLPWMEGKHLDILDSLTSHLPNILEIEDPDAKPEEEKPDVPDYIARAVEKHSKGRIISDVELSRHQLRRMFSNSYKREEAAETNIQLPEEDNRKRARSNAPHPSAPSQPRFNPRQHDDGGDNRRLIPVFRIATIVCLIAVIAAAFIIAFRYESGLINSPVVYQSELAALYTDTGSAEGLPEGALPSFEQLYKINSEVRGYLSIPGTDLSQPIVYSAEGAPDKYASLDFYQKPDNRGSLYFDIGNSFGKDADNYNLVVYGSSPDDGSLFSELLGYKDMDYLAAHPIINMDTFYDRGQWLIFSICVVSGDTISEFNYANTAFVGKHDHQIHLYNLYIRSLFYTGTEVFPTDDILTLVTDSDEFSGAKLLICARKVRDGEDLSMAGQYVVENDRVMMPDVWYSIKKVEKPIVPALELPTEATTTFITTTTTTAATTTTTTTTAATTTATTAATTTAAT